MKEADLKLVVSEYLQYGHNQGRWYADRLNSGEVIVVAGQSRRRVKLCREGTADFMVIQKATIVGLDRIEDCIRVIFLELKGNKGKQRPEQGAFQKVVESQGASYFIIRSIEDLENILEVN